VAPAGNSRGRAARRRRGGAARAGGRAGPRGGGTRRVLRFCPRRRAGGRPAIRTGVGPADGRRNFTPGGFTVSLIIFNGYPARARRHRGQYISVVFRLKPAGNIWQPG